ncbi:MAG: hypothetical protein EPO52_00340 [Herbiconiux sp.]|uniref:hypothetical protein n=1 Tax=Herbiconiux sp. TaxID=1871186 RepID=UPI0012011227|nr:hypothetical protein [Herbiconiux sp.]TAJ50303.1 MAG: hypothetical protein EPO52_00340 [Herbiconiux sp.]
MRIRHAVVAAVIGLGVALGAAGCVAPTPAPSPTVSAVTPVPTAPAPTSTPAPTPTPTAAGPVSAPDDPSTWIIDFSGVGPVKIGDTIDEVTASIPVQGESCRPGVIQFFGSSIVALGAVGSDDPTGGSAPVVLAMVGRTTDATPGYPSTATGITIGSTIAELQAAYPDLETYQSYSGTPAYRVTDGTTWLHFAGYGTDTVASIAVATVDQTPTEYCG